MSKMNLDTLRNEISVLKNSAVAARTALPPFEARYERYVSPDEYHVESDWFSIRPGDQWRCAFRTTLRMRTSVQAPECQSGQALALEINAGGEAAVRVNGVLLESATGTPLGYQAPGTVRDRVMLPEDIAGKMLDIEIEVCMYFQWCNEQNRLAGADYIPAMFSQADLVVIDLEKQALYEDVRIAVETAGVLDDAALCRKLTHAAGDAVALAHCPKEARETLHKALAALSADERRVMFVGQAHIDTAWLWTIRESIRKCQRTFSNVLGLMERHPEFVFAFSQPALFDYVKKYYPDLFARIQEKVAQGKIELVGNAWVEMDANVPSGESLVRQLLYGRQFYLENFGKESKIFWMPDVFGYSWALPQIMKRSGVEYFFTSKLINNDTNAFPHSLFTWEGIDGTKVPAYLQRLNYNGMLTPETVKTIDGLFDQRDISDVSLMTFGYGDGGGGPTEEMLQAASRMKNFPGLPHVELTTAAAFFAEVEKVRDQLPNWKDEMYYENHRGTYTSQARTKKNNRDLEKLLRKLEIAAATAKVYLDEPYPLREISDIWREMLTLRFHDILPGSSIHPVYTEAEETHRILLEKAQALYDSVMAKLAARAGKDQQTWNFTPWEAKGILPLSCGTAAKSDEQTTVTTGLLENGKLCVAVDENGLLTSIYDKVNQREVLADGAKGNLLSIFKDRPARESAWNIELSYQDSQEDLVQAESMNVVTLEDGQQALRVVRRYGNSCIEQDMVLRPGAARLDFVTRVDWHEREKMLKCAFPVDIHAQRATYEIQFGAIERPNHWNTSYDRAKFEVCGHRWADLSEHGYGVSLLNDCKYGYDIYDNRMRLTLLRSPNHPDPTADEGFHTFTYALYPHTGDWRCGTMEQAYQLNCPLEEHAGNGSGLPGPLAQVMSEHVALDTIKGAEDGRGVVIRFYECFGSRGPVKVRFGKQPVRVTECSLMEVDEAVLPCENSTVELCIKPYEIRTLRVEF